MPREYRHIQQFEKALSELRGQGKTHREIAEILGLTKEQVKSFLKGSV